MHLFNVGRASRVNDGLAFLRKSLYTSSCWQKTKKFSCLDAESAFGGVQAHVVLPHLLQYFFQVFRVADIFFCFNYHIKWYPCTIASDCVKSGFWIKLWVIVNFGKLMKNS